MPPAEEADDSNAIGVEVPVGGVGPGEAHGLLGVFEVGWVGGEMADFGDAIFDEDAGHAEVVAPGAGVEAFAVPSEHAIAAAGEDEGGSCGCWWREAERRP